MPEYDFNSVDECAKYLAGLPTKSHRLDWLRRFRRMIGDEFADQVKAKLMEIYEEQHKVKKVTIH